MLVVNEQKAQLTEALIWSRITSLSDQRRCLGMLCIHVCFAPHADDLVLDFGSDKLLGSLHGARLLLGRQSRFHRLSIRAHVKGADDSIILRVRIGIRCLGWKGRFVLLQSAG